MKISQNALRAFNAHQVVSFNDAYNEQHRLGTKAEADALQRIANAKWGICRDGESLTRSDILAAGHTYGK